MKKNNKMKMGKWIGCLLLCLLFVGCSSDNDIDEKETYSGIPLVILDVDIPSSTDDFMNTYYGYPDLPIGLVREGIEAPSVNGICRYLLPGSAEWNQQMLERIRKTS